jgi:hypothetical protein
MITYKHEPAGYEDILGCSGYPNQESIACFLANGDNNFLNEGIVQNSLLYIDTKGRYEEGKLNVFDRSDEEPRFKVSRSKVKNAQFFGRVILIVNQCD